MKDFNHDGWQDLAVGSLPNFHSSDPVNNPGQLHIYHGGPAGLTLVQQFPISTVNTKAVDLNLDGHLDIFSYGFFTASSNNSTTIRAFINNGDGTFTVGNEFDTGYEGYKMDVADVNNDRIQDFALVTKQHLPEIPGYPRLILGDGQGWVDGMY